MISFLSSIHNSKFDIFPRRVTTTGRPIARDAFEEMESFFNKCNRKLRDVNPASIFNMDEIAIRLDSPHNSTYELIGSQRVAATTTGNEQARLSVAFCASASGEKLPLVVIVPRKTPLKVALISTLTFYR